MNRVKPIEVNVRLLNFINKRIPLGNFYNISATSTTINLQGSFNPELIKLLHTFGLILQTESVNGYLCARYKRIEITLT